MGMHDVGVRFSQQSANFYRVHSSELSAFLIKVQRKGDFIFSCIELHPIKEQTIHPEAHQRVFNGHYRQRESLLPMLPTDRMTVDEVDTEAVDDFELAHRNGHVVDPIDHRSMVDSHGY